MNDFRDNIDGKAILPKFDNYQQWNDFIEELSLPCLHLLQCFSAWFISYEEFCEATLSVINFSQPVIFLPPSAPPVRAATARLIEINLIKTCLCIYECLGKISARLVDQYSNWTPPTPRRKVPSQRELAINIFVCCTFM